MLTNKVINAISVSFPLGFLSQPGPQTASVVTARLSERGGQKISVTGLQTLHIMYTSSEAWRDASDPLIADMVCVFQDMSLQYVPPEVGYKYKAEFPCPHQLG